VIRAAGIADAFGIAHVHVTSWRETYVGLVPDAFLARLSTHEPAFAWGERVLASLEAPDDFIRVATDDATGEILGFVSARFTDGAAGREAIATVDGAVVCRGEISALYVLAAAHRRGFGRSLFESARAHFEAHARLPFGLWVVAGNPAESFYRRLGGVAIGEKASQIDGARVVNRAYAFL
jgi:GNAT superfamily N-acetyltransferase